MADFLPSRRAQANLGKAPAWSLMQRVNQIPPYDPKTQPDGLINLSGALNNLMQGWWDEYFAKSPIDFDLSQILPYGSISGTDELLSTAAGFFNRFFRPSVPLEANNILAANGITSLIDLVSWTLCDPGEAILYPTPTFYMLDFDLGARNNVTTVPVPCSFMEDRFSEEVAPKLLSLLEKTVAAQLAKGVRCKVLFICNPANPQGRCYSAATLASLARFCRSHGMHLVADEVYSMSQYSSGLGSLDQFSSVLGIPEERPGSLSHVHCLYSLSKDFNMGGLRLGFLVTRNAEIRAAADTVTWFTWISSFSALLVTQLLGDLDTISGYFSVYRKRLELEYWRTSEALTRCGIPYQASNSGLFIFIDLSQWVGYFSKDKNGSRELNLCYYLIEHGVCLNPGEYAGSDRPGWFRFVFTEMPEANVLAIERIRKAIDLLPKMSSQRLENGRTSIDTATTLQGESAQLETAKMEGVAPSNWSKIRKSFPIPSCFRGE
ncbi:hypothetical protein PFICI_11825 [Pestalotiopsis fici W106-1]|uniref:Aminotransferase class I/classII large domain-containing protein n=1 Tax=Pestalotiopsis fici (strain W106-1 / CGMCC3.15140) TaxID=1229662 RepID=W3WRG1_PESFW|nr:uncharacterized protein PFICI_11825 [Pestalotiopsis fici W106-1]ETS76438.1 hypothetical protein PFICI_11825 [Pestalotiopsis fici W106-1]